MPHAFSESEHRFSQCGHFNQVEPFEKSRFLIIFPLLLKPTFALVQARGHNYENTLKHIWLFLATFEGSGHNGKTITLQGFPFFLIHSNIILLIT